MKVADEQLKAFLLDQKVISAKDIKSAEKKAEETKKPFETILLEGEFVTEERLTELKAYIRGVPYISLSDIKITPALLQLIPEEFARKRHVVAIDKRETMLDVAMIDPDDLQTIEAIKKRTGLEVRPRLVSASDFKEALQSYRKSLTAEVGELIDIPGVQGELEKTLAEAQETATSETGEDLQKIAEEVPIIRIVDMLIRHAELGRASDIHIEPGEKEVVVRYRVDGILQDAMVLPREVHAGIVARIKVLSNLKLDEHRLPQDGRFKMAIEDEKISFRVSILPTFYGEKVVMRLLREDVQGLTLENLGFQGEALERVHRAIKRPNGMILVTGPTGSGKTTTLYTILDILNTPEVNISTIEDPIEYQVSRVNQTQVQPDIGLTFAAGLRSLVRQDPDIIMVGEIRDEETASLAVNAALTGHLVLSTLHTNSAAGALPRLLDMGIEAYLIASTVNVIVGQRLVRKLCSEKDEKKLSKKDLAGFLEDKEAETLLHRLQEEKFIPKSKSWGDLTMYRPKESEDCPEGYRGRMGIFEVMEVTENIQKMFTAHTTADELEHKARDEGMLTMLEDGFVKVLHGLTTLEEVFRVTKE